ncbi:ribonuclease E/G [Ochrobactrum sp. P6BS-III]|uniref:Rne/Rng family ribonuclease n=1 Tax=unclassified Ochrobactrum TaxID=239106 RepID=UPI0009935943|nr:ribonuclease E [Ochrobactrum sp. P6BSIII]OOL17522.1 ribonuclease E/G [Ochrobactrum sp. P6BS-III]
MSNKMLIDASHPEETRVIVTRGNKIEEFDFESEHKKQLKGNIYLARVTRVEPSLQAAFVEYGGNRHGFLAFSEIHPDYYQIPVADRLALLEAEAKAQRAEDDDDDEPRAKSERSGERSGERSNDRSRRNRRRGGRDNQNKAQASTSDNGLPAAEPVGPGFVNYVPGTPASALSHKGDVISEAVDSGDEDDIEHEEDMVESVGSEDALEELPTHTRTHRRQYNIQEVIKRRQILLVQVVKEERGNKGAALTTYLSLAGRYSVLMPNTARGGGISRKITQPQDRKRLKEIVKELEVPQGMGVILRTAGANRTKAEVKRDYEYLMRLWENVRTLTLQSTAPSLVYEEGSLIKRSIRDLYNKDITEILVSGENGYREAKDFMRMLMPSHAKVVQPYREQVPIFTRNGVEAQLDRMLLPQVTLKSGGYLIINQTEALVAIDVNSGRSTREHSIEDTALQTNLEAAEEVARQLRLRDLAGLIVVDFIDMEEKRNNRAVEKKMKDCLKDDRARIQVGRISHFGLLEMSRQRIRASVLESTMQVCQHCGGTGHVRSDSSMALHIIRGIEDYLLRHSGFDINVRTPAASALYVLNHKRQLLADLEGRFGVAISIDADESVGHQHFAIDKGAPSTRPVTQPPVQPMAYIEDDFEDPEIPVEEDEEEEDVKAEAPAREERSEEGDRKRRRRRRRRGGKDRDSREQTAQDDAASDEADDDAEDGDEASEARSDAALSDDDRRKKRRRGRRGGRKNRREDEVSGRKVPDPEFVGYTPVLPAKVEAAIEAATAEVVAAKAEIVEVVEAVAVVTEAAEAPAETEKPAKTARKPRARKPAKTEEAAEEVVVAEVEEAPAKPARKNTRSRKKADDAPAAPEAVETPEAVEAEKPKRRTRKAAAKPVAEVEEAVAVEAEAEVAVIEEPAKQTEPVVTSSDTDEQKPKRGGWWQKKGFF